MKTKNFVLKIVFALAIAFIFYYVVKDFTIKNWNTDESLIVKVIEAAPEKIIPPVDETEETYEMLERDLVVKILSKHDGENILTIKTVRLSGSALEIVPGRDYLLVWDMFSDGRVQYSIADSFRVPSVAGIIMGVCTMLIALTGYRGLFALLGLGASIAVLIFTMIPLITNGWPPVILALCSVLIISTVTILCVVHHVRYMLVSLLGSLGGVLCGFLCGAFMVYMWQLSGLAGEGAALLASTLPSLNMQGVLLSSVLIGSIGAVLDVGVSVTASMSELVDYDPDIHLDRLLLAGLNVGSEVLGSMINTLILAYMGSSLPMAILICSAGVELSGILNDPYIAQEIVQSLAGTLGLLFTIPTTAFCFVFQEAVRRKND
ncbi:MAG: YibE/F family protein [Synergistaceae bacterium]|nr:YibE/F family protein [Synergistaceae bacterium]